MAFDALARFPVYAALLSDASGRIQQLTIVCPGVIVIAAAGWWEHRGEAQGLLDQAQRGVKLPKIIDAALALEKRIERRDDLSPCARLLVRRCPVVPYGVLCGALRAPGIDINDMPSREDAEGLRAWYQASGTWGHMANRHSDEAKCRRLGGFVSRHAIELLGSGRDIAYLIREIVDWHQATNATLPGRRTPPEAVQCRLKEWYAFGIRCGHDPNLRFPPGPDASEVVGIEAERLSTVGALVAESHEMQHCVASLADAALAGELFFYRATIAGARVTIAVVFGVRCWHLSEAAGRANRPLTADELVVVERWASGLRVAS
jgi:hypothetical protein